MLGVVPTQMTYKEVVDSALANPAFFGWLVEFADNAENDADELLRVLALDPWLIAMRKGTAKRLLEELRAESELAHHMNVPTFMKQIRWKT